MTNINICQCMWTFDVWPQGPVQQPVSWQIVLGCQRHSRLQDRTLERIHAVYSVPLASDWVHDLAGWCVSLGSVSPPVSRCGQNSPRCWGSGQGIGITVLLPVSLSWHEVMSRLALVLRMQESSTEITDIILGSHVDWDSQSDLYPKNQP